MTRSGWWIGIGVAGMLACGTAAGPSLDPGPEGPGSGDISIPEDAPAPGDVFRDPGSGGPEIPGEEREDPGLDFQADVPGGPDGPAEDRGSGNDPGVDSSDPGVPDVPSADEAPDGPQADLLADPGNDAPEDSGGGPAETLEPWTQCREDAECQAVFGPQAWCNHDFPGGQCAGCDPYDLGHERCTLLGRSGLTLSCKETVPNVCLFDCPCPSWLRCADLGDLQVCVLKTCREDTECKPLVCRPLSEGGASYCLAPL